VIVLFGGLSSKRLNDIFVYDINEQKWTQKETQGRAPLQRCFHTTFYDGSFIFYRLESTENLYLYAGLGDNSRSLGDFYFLNLW
jgi:hypothetical protein